MKDNKFLRHVTSRRFGLKPAISLLIVALLVPIAAVFASDANAAATPVLLGTATSFGVLAGSGITNTGPTTINGDVGTYPTTSITGAGSLTINGTNHDGDAVAQQAKLDLGTAYNSAASQGPTIPIVADLGGQTLTAGVYNSASSIGLTGALTLNGAGDPNSVFVFQAGSTLTTASASQIDLINGAQACNVFWQIGSSATLGTDSNFTGTVMALTSISVSTSVVVSGRVLAQNGAVTLDADTISTPACATATTTTTTAPGSSVTTTTISPTAAVTKAAAAKTAAAKTAAAKKAAKKAAAKIKAAKALAVAATKAPATTTTTVVPIAPPSPIGTTALPVTG